MEEDFAPLSIYTDENYERIIKIIKNLKDQLGEKLHPIDVSSKYVDIFHYSWDLQELDQFVAFQKMHQTQKEESPIILEIGSGIGAGSRFLASKYNFKIVGIEIMEQSINFGKRINEFFPNYNCFEDLIKHIVGDFMNMDLSTHMNFYDGAFTNQVLNHISDKKIFLKRIYDCLKPGAPFFFNEWGQKGDLTPEEMEIAIQTWEMRGLPTFEEWTEYFKESGLNLLEVKDVTEQTSKFCWERYQRYQTWYDDPNSEYWQKSIKEVKDGYATGPKLLRKISNPQDYPLTYEVAKDFLNKSQGMQEYYFFGIKPTE